MRLNSRLLPLFGLTLFFGLLGCGDPSGPTAEEIESPPVLTPEPLSENKRLSEPIQPLQNK